MSTPVSERTALLIIRAWQDGTGPAGVRARVTSVADLNTDQTTGKPLAGSEAILVCVWSWLQEVSARS